MKESKIFQCSLLTSGLVAQPDKWNSLFSEFLGICIAPAASPYHEGTKGLYLRIRGTKRMVLLTCRHVAFTEREANEDFQHRSAADLKKIIQPSTGTPAKARESVNENIKRSERIMEKNKDLPWASTVRKLNEAMAEKAAGETLAQRLSDLEDTSNRTIGHVLFSPKISEGRSPSGEERCRDWTLIKLNQKMHEIVLKELTNRVFCGMTAKSHTWNATKAELKGFTPSDHYRLKFDNETHTIELKGTIAKDIMAAPPTESVSLQDPALVVAMHGRITGLSIGVTNEVVSIKRNSIGPEE
ncbi:hypothetical protein CEP53_002470 [Fusarium sp. AF-6]|nr:hypothetical protein CEP53_002470 [Fusarium sp. AF-6]